jgi:hypothetical protein
MRVTVTLEFSSASPLTPEGFRKWLTVNLSEHLEAEHKYDEGTCPPLGGIDVSLDIPKARVRTRVRKVSIPNGK